MTIDDLSTLSAVTLAGSLAMERLVTIAKTLLPWLSEEKAPRPGESSMRADQKRRLSVLFITMFASLATAYFVGSGTAIPVGKASSVPWPVFGFLISGGSAFWTNIVGYSSATKDIAVQQRQVAIRNAAAPAVATTSPAGTIVGSGAPRTVPTV